MKRRPMINGMSEQVTQKVSEGATVASGAILGATWIAEAEPYVAVFAALVAAVAAGAAAWSRIENAKYLREMRKRNKKHNSKG